jgi:hypothetical protein
METQLKKLNQIKSINELDFSGACILWNIEQSEDMHGEDYDIDFHFFVKYRNPCFILSKIEKIFDERSFKSPLRKEEHLNGHVEGSVNDYILVTYTTSRAPEKISFDWTEIPVKFDKCLSKSYRKNGKLEDYVSKFI